ncbi:MAG: UDP-N-acetylmuramoyl-L-alanyl-D-glutamate--2,6-diaminopimelate ligase [Capnocytophaga sp.]|nr:UDP-N-acetylmuramoyl-L-alanyl-D-glutamate--2,6-diaminopimelate ligase [Capnocytophaga sp.]
MILKEILKNISVLQFIGNNALEITDVTQDSRKIEQGTLFIAIKGANSDGHSFINKAIQAGAKAILCQELPKELPEDISFIKVEDTTLAMPIIAANFYQNPSKELKLVGVTGTNGKTTISTLLFHLFKQAGYKVGLISTIAIYINDKQYETKNTTPDALTLHYILRKMRNEGVEYCFMEVSSHGIALHRIDGLHFVGGIFTNLTHDHLDFHKTFAEYRDTKKKFFDLLPKDAFAITNHDDKNGDFMLQNTKAHKYTYALKSFADYRAQIIENTLSGLVLRINQKEIWTNLIGEFNAYNLLAIYATAISLGMDKEEVEKGITLLHSVNGRFQYFISPNKITVIVDYAHTPDALKNVLETIQSIRTGNETLFTIVGCGGNRDKSKRPLMASIATSLSNKVVFTSDNPRDEDPEIILKEMETGVPSQFHNKYLVISDREQAIKTICSFAKSGDIILIAGKGHETYQEIKGKRIHFDDMEQAKQYFAS